MAVDLARLACSIFIIMSEGDRGPEIGDSPLSSPLKNSGVFSRDITFLWKSFEFQVRWVRQSQLKCTLLKWQSKNLNNSVTINSL